MSGCWRNAATFNPEPVDLTVTLSLDLAGEADASFFQLVTPAPSLALPCADGN